MPAMHQRHPVWFAALVGRAIGAVVGLAFSAVECSILWRTGILLRAPHDRLFFLIVAPAAVCCLYGAVVGTAGSANLFGRRTSVLFTGFLIVAILSIATGLGLWPLCGPLLDGIFLHDPVGILITICVIAMMAANPVWPGKWWTRIISAFGVASWILCGLVNALRSV